MGISYLAPLYAKDQGRERNNLWLKTYLLTTNNPTNSLPKNWRMLDHLNSLTYIKVKVPITSRVCS